MSRMAAAYSLQKMRKALNELRNSVAIQKEAQKEEAQNNMTSSFRENSNHGHPHSGGTIKINEKRSGANNNIDDDECECLRKNYSSFFL